MAINLKGLLPPPKGNGFLPYDNRKDYIYETKKQPGLIDLVALF